MELSAATAGSYLRHAFDQMLDVADRVGESGINERPLGVETNAVASLIIHCCGVSEFWLGHVALGRSSQRVRDDEFAATATLAELHDLLATSLAQTIADLGRLESRADGVRRINHFFPDCRAARFGAFVADRKREVASVAISALARRSWKSIFCRPYRIDSCRYFLKEKHNEIH